MRNWLRTILFISAFSPALITMAYVKYDIYGLNREVIQLVIIGVLGTLLPIAIMRLVSEQGESFYIKVRKIESNDFILFAFIGSYLLPLVLKGTELSVSAIMTILFILGLILWLVNSIPTHPLLRMMRFKFYKLESTSGMVYILISKRQIKHPLEITSVKKISDTMLIEEG